MGKKQLDQVIALIHAALRNGQPQSWMYESLGIAMELDGRSKSEIERAVMSAADFSTSADELMYIAQYLVAARPRSARDAGLPASREDRTAPQRSVRPWVSVRPSSRDDLAGIRWATVGILSQAWPTDMAEIEAHRFARRQGHARATRPAKAKPPSAKRFSSSCRKPSSATASFAFPGPATPTSMFRSRSRAARFVPSPSREPAAAA